MFPGIMRKLKKLKKKIAAKYRGDPGTVLPDTDQPDKTPPAKDA